MTNLTATALVFVLGMAQGAPSSREAADHAELMRLETVWNEAHLRSDADALDRLWADDLNVAVPKMPVLNKAGALRFARSGRMKFQRYETSQLKIRLYDNAAVVTGQLLRTRLVNGQVFDDDWRFTKVYVRHGEQWQVVAFHASESAPAAAPQTPAKQPKP